MKFDDFAGLDLKGKIVVTIQGGPSSIPGNLRAHYGSASERGKFLEQAGAVGLVTIRNPRARTCRGRARPWRVCRSMSLADQALVDMQEHQDRGHRQRGACRQVAGRLRTHDRRVARSWPTPQGPLPRFPLNASLRARVKVDAARSSRRTSCGVLRGTDPALRDEYVVLSAHLDHSASASAINGDTIYNGAMDNASGVRTADRDRRGLHDASTKPARSLLFVAVTGEEKGLLGSRYFAAHPTVPRQHRRRPQHGHVPAALSRSVLTVYGLDESDLGDGVRTVAAAVNVEVQADPAAAAQHLHPQRSVQLHPARRILLAVKIGIGSRKGSPEDAVEKAWLTNRYHAPSDDLHQPVDLAAAAAYNRFMMTLATTVANNTARPMWKPRASSSGS